MTVGHHLALRVGAAELRLHLRRPDLAGAQGERPGCERIVLRADGALLVGEGGRGVGHPDGPCADVNLLVLGGHGGHVVRDVVLPALKPPKLPYSVAKTGIMEASPSPHTVISLDVAFILRCLPRRSPDGPNHSCVRYRLPPSFSVTDTHT